MALPLAATGGLAALALTGPAMSAAPAVAAHSSTVHVAPDLGSPGGAANLKTLVSPIPTSQCQAQLGISCYSPLQYRVAYDLNPLYNKGITGAGKTIVIVDSFGSPTIQADLNTFDAQWGLPSTTVDVQRFGTIPAFDPTDPTMVGWAQETTLDVEYAHSIAPGAKIVLAETPVAETEGVTGLPEMMNAEQTLINQGVPDVITQSFGATENTFPGFDQGNFTSLLDLRYAFKDAAAHHVTVLASSGDQGATGAEADGSTLYPYPVNSWPSSDPLVTSIGGTQLKLDDAGNRLSPDVVWNDGHGAGGGGLSQIFSRPLYQIGVTGVVDHKRGTPDISMSSAVDGGAWVYYSFTSPGWHIFGGTSEASPIFSGVVALADQYAHHDLGLINPALYTLGALSRLGVPGTGIVDVTSGDNSFAGVTGYPATKGYDLASGWGTIDAAKFVPALARIPGA
ncbi:MAG TPA: S53 family peptidase [Streptosporangiaceae bacterium]|jgi:subtilase family serine protease|nr:S53 family peptidase [Streptosporangiaceae bacterium]